MTARCPVSVIVFTYNQRSFVEEAVKGAFAQDLPVEIIISDDRSSDGTAEELKRLVSAYRGPHKVQLRLGVENLGVARHLNEATALATGDLIVLAAGDDVSRPARARILWENYGASGRPTYLWSHATVVNERGAVCGALPRPAQATFSVSEIIANGSPAIGACSAISAGLLRQGGIPPAILREDVLLSYRAALHGTFRYVADDLVTYRRHANTLWGIGSRGSADVERRRLLLHAPANVALYGAMLHEYVEARADELMDPLDRHAVIDVIRLTKQLLHAVRMLAAVRRGGVKSYASTFGTGAPVSELRTLGSAYLQGNFPRVYSALRRHVRLRP
jgi:glycosyltransferase involved in cell wall biosynthesis